MKRQTVRTPNWATTEAYTLPQALYSRGDPLTIPAGSFVSPIKLDFVPKHVIEDSRWKSFNASKDIFVYTKYGFVVMPKDIVKER